MADVPAIRAALAQVREGGGFAAHEVLEVLWRAADRASATSTRGSSTSPSRRTRSSAATRSAVGVNSRRRSAA